jgi:segregation and condensation protein A
LDTILPQEVPAEEAFRIALPHFEGPLDLLLHLIKEHKLDVLDIPIALVAEKYLEHLAQMRELNLDVAGEFLVMASTLAHLKSRLLLPKPELRADVEGDDAQGDPREELVRRLLEYQKYKAAAEALGGRALLDRDTFVRRVVPEKVPSADDELGLVEISVFKLIEALDRVLKNAAPEIRHEVTRERVSLSDAIHTLADRLRAEGTVPFRSLFEGERQRHRIIILFLAVLEMCKLRLIRVDASQETDDLLLCARGEALMQPLVTTEVEG